MDKRKLTDEEIVTVLSDHILALQNNMTKKQNQSNSSLDKLIGRYIKIISRASIRPYYYEKNEAVYQQLADFMIAFQEMALKNKRDDLFENTLAEIETNQLRYDKIQQLKFLIYFALKNPNSKATRDLPKKLLNEFFQQPFTAEQQKSLTEFLADAVNLCNYKHPIWLNVDGSNLIWALGGAERSVDGALNEQLLNFLVRQSTVDADFTVKQIAKSKAISLNQDIDFFDYINRPLSTWFIATYITTLEPDYAFRMFEYTLSALSRSDLSNFKKVVQGFHQEAKLIYQQPDIDNQLSDLLARFIASKTKSSLKALLSYHLNRVSIDFFALLNANPQHFDDNHIQDNFWTYARLLDYLDYQNPSWKVLLRKITDNFLNNPPPIKVYSERHGKEVIKTKTVSLILHLLVNAIELDDVYADLIVKLDEYYCVIKQDNFVYMMGDYFYEVYGLVYSFYGKNAAITEKVAQSKLHKHIDAQYLSFIENTSITLIDDKDVSGKLSSMIQTMYSGSEDMRAWTKQYFIEQYKVYEKSDRAICLVMLKTLANNLTTAGRDYAFIIRSRDDAKYKTQHEVLDVIKPEGFEFKHYSSAYVPEWN